MAEAASLLVYGYEENSMELSSNFSPDDLNSPAAVADPYPFYRHLRAQSPVNYIHLPGGIFPGIAEPVRAWALMKYEDVYGALRDHDTFSSARNPLIEKGFFPPLVLITDDPPRHTRFRRLVNKAFTLKRIETLEPWIAGIANELLDEIGTGEVDIIQSYTMPLPVKVVARLLGIPGEEYLTFKRWSDASLSVTTMTPEERMANIQEMMAYFGKMASARRSQGAEDLITALVEAELEGESLQDWEIL